MYRLELWKSIGQTEMHRHTKSHRKYIVNPKEIRWNPIGNMLEIDGQMIGIPGIAWDTLEIHEKYSRHL